MAVNYLKIAFRYLLKNRSFSIINIFGLTLGFACFVLVALYIHDELSFDLFHKDASRIHRVIQHEKMEDGTIRTVAQVAARIAPEALKQLPEIADAVRISALGRITMGNDPVNRGYEITITVDDNFFTFFDFKLIQGDPVTALKIPDGIVISERYAKKYFGNEPAMGKRLWASLTREGERVEFTVTGIMKAFPKNSHLQMDIIFAERTWLTVFPWYEPFINSDWETNTFITYVKTKEGVDLARLGDKIKAMVKANYSTENEFKSTFSLQPLQDVHLYSDKIQGDEVNESGVKPFYLYMFAGVAMLILLIACLNYMNLSTAAAYKRTREIGTRKTLGAMKSQLIAQFFGEAIMLSAVSLALALTFVQLILPWINAFTEKELALGNMPSGWLMIILIAALISGILSSLYPAFVISRVMPAQALKKDVKFGNKSVPVRKLLVVAQFTISIMMIASTLIIYKQLKFIQAKTLGFEVDGLLVIDINSGALRTNFEAVKSEFKKVAEVQSISTSTRVPGEWKSFPIATINTSGSPLTTESIFVGIDQDFLDTYKITLLEGRNFVSGNSDSTKVILTKLAVERLGLTNPIGQIVEIPRVRSGGHIRQLEKTFSAEVIGVSDNFHFESFRQEMMPLIFGAPNTVIQQIDYYTIRVRTNNWNETIKKLKEANTRLDPEDPLEYTFLDKTFEGFYRADIKRGQIFLVFSSVIVLIACLGLFALVSYAIESRTKEIGIRKVLGASVESIVRMISKEFLLLVLAAGLAGIPITYLLMQRWLEEFAYHIPIGAEIFIAASLVAILIAFITISIRSIRAAMANPVDSLRNE